MICCCTLCFVELANNAESSDSSVSFDICSVALMNPWATSSVPDVDAAELELLLISLLGVMSKSSLLRPSSVMLVVLDTD